MYGLPSGDYVRPVTRQQPCRYAAEDRDELSPSHSITPFGPKMHFPSEQNVISTGTGPSVQNFTDRGWRPALAPAATPQQARGER
jgi:hypothetical protein